MQKTYSNMRRKLAYVFILLIILVWLDELIDFPGVFYGVEKSPVNWLESIIETIVIAAVAFFTISRFVPKQKRFTREEELKGTRHIWIPVISLFLGLCVIVWLNELIDLPYLFFNGDPTPVNWSEAAVETLLIIIVGVIAVTILMRNITERARAQDLFFRSFYFNPIPAAITTIADGKVIQANEAFFKITGYKPDDFLEHSILKSRTWTSRISFPWP